MDSSLCYPDLKPVTENIMSVMHELKEKNFTDNTLLSNLDFAERFLRDHPLKTESKLLVKGDHSCVQIGRSYPKVFTVTKENNKTHVSLLICKNNGKIIKNSVDIDHFFNHSCQDEIQSCFTRAQEAVTNEGVTKLHIKCNRFSITYTTGIRGPDLIVETKCQLKLNYVSAEGLLNKKVWLEKEKPTCHGLIACLNHLIIQYLTMTTDLLNNYRFVLHGDNEIIIITAGERNVKQIVLLHDHEGVSMFPPTL